MKKWLIGLLILGAIVAIVYLDSKGIIGWQPLSMLFAAIAAPFRLLMGIFGNKEEEIRRKHAAIRQQEAEYQSQLEGKILTHEQRVLALAREVEVLDARIEVLKKRRAQVDAEVDKMSVSQLQKAGKKYFGS
ncbi:MAG: hypothetical protein ACE5HS_22465 [bacterium]